MNSIDSIPPRSALVLDEEGKFQIKWYGWFSKLRALLVGGFTGTITTAKLTGGGANGSMTFQNGILVSQTPAT